MKVSEVISEGLLDLAYAAATGKVAGPEAKTKIEKLKKYRDSVVEQAVAEITEKKQDPKSYFQSFFGGISEPDEVRLKVAQFLNDSKNIIPPNSNVRALQNTANKLVDVQIAGLKLADQRGQIQFRFKEDLVNQYKYNPQEIEKLSDAIYKDFIVNFTGDYNSWLSKAEDKVEKLISKTAAQVTTPPAPPIKIITQTPLVVNFKNKEYEYDIGTKTWRSVSTGRLIKPSLSDAISRAYNQIKKSIQTTQNPQVFKNIRTGKVSSSPITKS